MRPSTNSSRRRRRNRSSSGDRRGVRGVCKAASDESVRRGRRADVEFKHGDFAQVGPSVPMAHVVTLDRMVCCYPVYEPLLSEALRHTSRAMALSYPRDRWFVKVSIRLENALRGRKNKLRTFVHPEIHVRELVANAGFALAFRKHTLVWSGDVFVRQA